MLLQTNSYVVPREKRAEHARLLRRFRQTLARIGCDHFEVYEQVGANWSTGEPTGRYVQIMRFRDRRHQQAVQAAERTDPGAQALIAEFCALINFPYQQQQGLFAVGFYSSVLPVAPARAAETGAMGGHAEPPADEPSGGVEEAAAPDAAGIEHDPVSESAVEGMHQEEEQGGAPVDATEPWSDAATAASDNGEADDVAGEESLDAEMSDEYIEGEVVEGELQPDTPPDEGRDARMP